MRVQLTSKTSVWLLSGTLLLGVVLLLGAVVLLVALVLTEEETPQTVVVTATASAGNQGGIVQITATPDDTPTPQPVAVPTLPPGDAISEAEQALFNGDYASAVTHYQSVINQDFVDPDLLASAYYGQGKAALREGLFEDAIFDFSEFIKLYPEDSRIPQAHFMRGEAYLGANNWQSAIDDFNRYLELRPGVIDSYAHERTGDAYLALGSPGQAFQSYLQAADSTRTLVSSVALRERIAASYVNQGLYEEAVGQYDAILAEAQNNGYRASIELQAARTELNGGLANRGYSRMRAMLDLYPETPAAYQAMVELLNAGREVDSWLQARISFNNEDYGSTVAALDAYRSEVGTLPAEALIMLGQAYRALGNFDAALTTFQTALDQYPDSPLYGAAWLDKGRTYFQAGRFLEAVNHYTQLATDRPADPNASEGLWRAGYIYATQLDDVERALATFDILSRSYPGDEWAQDGLLIASSLALNNGLVERAQGFYTQLANTGTGENRAMAFLWLGRLYRDQGLDEYAEQSFMGASQSDPGGYYSLRAQDILTGRDPFSPPPDYQFEFDESVAIADAEQWLRDTFGIQQAGLLYPLSDALRNDPHMIRGQELWELAAYDEARGEFETLRQQVVDDPLATYQLAHYFAEIGHYRASIEAAASLITRAGVSTFDAPGYIARLRYPIHYDDLVLPNAELNQLDPLLVFSLIRQESLFQSFATSFAAAQGLMQIIPSTGQDIANQLNWPDYQNSDVYRPYVNVHFGTYYLRWVMDNFVDGVDYAALAGYNGGPGNAQTWLSISGPDIDRFVQTVTFDETRRYITRIYEQYNVYRYLYGVEE